MTVVPSDFETGTWHTAADRAVIRAAAARLAETLRADTPTLAEPVLQWLWRLSPSGRIEDYFMHRRRFPMLLIPRWADQDGDLDEGFGTDVAYSTIAGYCYIRLVDDLIDESGPADLQRLPVAALFHTEFHGTYVRHFEARSPFWKVFRATWLAAADAAFDRLEPGAALPAFNQRTASRLGPALIPLAAVCLRRLERGGSAAWTRLHRWRAFISNLARLEQLFDDLCDWQEDLARGSRANVLLAIGMQELRDDQPLAAWMVRDGVPRGHRMAAHWLAELEAEARGLGSPGALAFVADRHRLLAEQRREVEPGLAELARLASGFGAG